MSAKDSRAGQLYEACGRKRLAATILEYFVAVFHDNKKRKHPKADNDDPVLWLDFTQPRLATKFRCSVKTIARRIKDLVDLKFLTPHQVSGYDRGYRYELHIGRVESLHQDMPLFEVAHADKMSASMQTKCPHAYRQNVRMEPDKMSASPRVPSGQNVRIDPDKMSASSLFLFIPFFTPINIRG